jgi:HlyD family secretion protein
MAAGRLKKWIIVIIVLAIALAGIGYGLRLLDKPDISDNFASGNGRLEATEVEITTKLAARIAKITVNEGDDVKDGEILARMDTKSLDARLRQAEAEVKRVRQERIYAAATIAQRKSELTLAEKDLDRSRLLYENENIALEQLQRNQTAVQTANAALAAAKAQLASAEAAIEAAIARTETITADIDDATLKAPISGRVLYRLVEPGEVLGAGGKILTILNLTDVYMTVFLPTKDAARIAVGAEARIVLDAIPGKAIPAKVSFVAPKAQFTPKEVETRTEREKLMFRIKVKIEEVFLKNNTRQIKTGVTGVAYIRIDPNAEWPEHLQALMEM